MTIPIRSSVLALVAGALTAGAASAQTLITDDFEVNSSANYTLVDDGSLDSTRDFAFDYVAAGIPLAPRSAAGDRRGLKGTINDTNATQDGWTLFHNTPIAADRFRLTVDVWMNFTLGGTGTTEHAHVGVGSDRSTWNQILSPINGKGAFIAFDGDGDSVSDYRWFRDLANTPLTDPFSSTLPSNHPSYRGNGSNNSGPFFQALFPSPPSTVAGSPGNIWTTVRVDVDNVAGVISFYFDDTLTFEGDFVNRLDGFVSLGMGDIFSSLSDMTNFTIYDNFVVEIPGTSGPIGTNYCAANPNSTGATGVMGAVGTDVLVLNDVTLTASNLPPGQFGIFVTSLTSDFTPNVGAGNLCVGGSIGRYQAPGQILQIDANGGIALPIDLTLMPQGPTLVPVNAGETWYFQAWHRDFTTTPPFVNTSNFTDGLEVTFN